MLKKQMVEERAKLEEEKKREEAKLNAQLAEAKKEKAAMDMTGTDAAEKLAFIHGE